MKSVFEKIVGFIVALIMLWLLFMFLGWAWDHKGAIFMLIVGIFAIGLVVIFLSNKETGMADKTEENINIDNEKVITTDIKLDKIIAEPVRKVMESSIKSIQYPALCECEFDENDNSRYFVSFRDIPEANSEGGTLLDTIDIAKESLLYTVNMYKIRGEQLPISSEATVDEIIITL